MTKNKKMADSLLNIPSEERQVQDQRQPVSVDKEQECQESMNGGFGNDVGVEAVAEVDRVDIVTADQTVSKYSHGERMRLMRSRPSDDQGMIRQRMNRQEKKSIARGAYHSKSLYMIVKKT